MASYEKLEPGQVANELHSILPTEYSKLPDKLEKYYRQYFKDRQKVVAAHAKFEKVFSDQHDKLTGQLNQIHELKNQLTVLNDQLEAYKNAGLYAKYNELIPEQNARVDEINGLIETYTQGVDEYNALSKSLNSQPITQTEKDPSWSLFCRWKFDFYFEYFFCAGTY